MSENTQICIACNQEKDLFGFKFNKYKNEFFKICDACLIERKQRRLEKKAKEKAIKMHTTYDIPMEEFLAIKEAHTKCQICGIETDKLNYDHCHKIGKGHAAYREVLCTNCNTSIGKLGDNVKGLQKALDYLKQFEFKNGDEFEESTY